MWKILHKLFEIRCMSNIFFQIYLLNNYVNQSKSGGCCGGWLAYSTIIHYVDAIATGWIFVSASVMMVTPMIPLASCPMSPVPPCDLDSVQTMVQTAVCLVPAAACVPPSPAPPQPGVFTFLPVAAVRWPPSHSPALSHIRTMELPRHQERQPDSLHTTYPQYWCHDMMYIYIVYLSISAARAWAGGGQVYRGTLQASTGQRWCLQRWRAQGGTGGTHWHTGTGGVLVLALSLPPASPPDSRTQQYSDPPPPSTSSTGTTRHQASSSSSPPYLWCDDGGPWDVGHSNTEQYICIQILDISRVSAGWQRLALC